MYLGAAVGNGNGNNSGYVECVRDPRKLQIKKLRNPQSVKIATLENFPLYSIFAHAQESLFMQLQNYIEFLEYNVTIVIRIQRIN